MPVTRAVAAVATAVAPVAPADVPSPASGGPLRLLSVVPAPGAQVPTMISVRFEFDRPLDPRLLAGAIAFEYPDPGVTLLVPPFRHVVLRLESAGRVLVAEPPELLVGRELTVRLSPALRGVDGSSPSPEILASLSYHVMELPP